MVPIKNKNQKKINKRIMNGEIKKRNPEYKRKMLTYLKNTCFLLLLFLGVLFLVKVKAHQVSGESMMPTLENGDRLFILRNEDPQRYSLITFEPKEKQEESYIKRVIGMPGDRIWLDQNTVYLNSQMAETNPTPPNEEHLSGVDLPDGTVKVRVDWAVAAKLEGLSTIPKDHYFVLGDNRRHSTDSRALGLIDKDQIEGVVKFRYFPFNRIGMID
ncbi:signal peptidase I [Enterococcus ureasiticus]|uniref:Signal peptidase I n=1 Tax=Enterococcus ureasiticus TaxID=903984 RepID=A0A1E5GA19_9ENTE|nr:signal peptidase I [Enterococcus ureasiticus]